MQLVKAFLGNNVFQIKEKIENLIKQGDINIIDISMSCTETSCQDIVIYEQK